ncbi:MAG TPA: flagellar basal body-associated FliL family protein [Burkholderiaceae bacterium]|nr:flagellar basal body-associated FliL family protein [Burkholderiaceae bacterium]
MAFLLVGGITAAAGGAAAWWGLQNKPATSASAVQKSDDPKNARKYVTLEKVVVMLHRKPGDASAHYLAADLVFKTTESKEKVTKEHLPLLRSVAVRALSALPMEKAELMTVDQFAAEIDRALSASYARDQREKPFSEVMIGKLIIE